MTQEKKKTTMRSICTHRLEAGFLVFCEIAIILIGIPTAASGSPSIPVAPLKAVTPESLIGLRAPLAGTSLGLQLVETGKGPRPMDTDGMADQGSATRTLRKAFPTVPLCQEWSPSGESARFPFAVEANERLVDALDKLERNSNESLGWLLLHKRIIVTTQGSATKVMERPVSVNVTADTLLEALEQVEVAYNNRYHDLPLVVRPRTPRLAFRGKPQVSGQETKITVVTEGTLREAVLAVLDEMEDPALCYGVSELADRETGIHYFALHMIKDDAPELNTYVDNDEAVQFDLLLQKSNERRAGYIANVRRTSETASDNTAP